jgi:iron complex outermembrane recepter protein
MLARRERFVWKVSSGRHSVIVSLAGLSSMVLQTPAFAQDAATTGAPQASEVGEIIVTAQKRAEKVQDIPKSVEVVNQAQLTEAGVTNLQDLGHISPSIQGSTALPSAPPAIRGIASFALSIGVQTKTGIILDDIPQPSYSTLANELTDVERVEVLAGPQSTLSGRNAAGGLINIVTHNPTDTFTGKINFEQTNDGQSRLGGFISGPVANQLSFSISAFYDRWDGNIINVAEGGEHIGGFDQRGVRGKLLWKPDVDLRILLSGYVTDGSFRTPGLIGGEPYVYAAPGANSILVPGSTIVGLHPGATIAPYSQEVSTPGNGTESRRNQGVSLRVDYDTSVGTVSSLTNYSHASDPRVDLFVAYPIDGQIARADTDVRVKYFYQELRLASPANSDKLKYLFGLVYNNTKNFEPYVREPVFPVDWNRDATVASFAAFGRVTYKVLPRVSLTGGLRFQADRLGYDFVFADGTAPESTGSTKYSFVSGEASLQYELTPDIKTYFTYSNAQSGKAYDLEDNVDAATPAGLTALPSETVNNYEAGIKGRVFDRRLSFSLAIFRADYQHYQVQAIQQSDGNINQTPTVRLYSLGQVRTQGVELSTTLAATNALKLGFDATYLDARILDYPGAQCYLGQTTAEGCISGLQDRRGVLPDTSKFRMTASANYTINLPSLPFDGMVGAFYRYQTRTYFDLFGDPVETQAPYGLLNLTAGIKDHSGRYNVELFVNNVANTHYYGLLTQDGFSSPLATYALYGRDSFRYFGGRIGMSF